MPKGLFDNIHDSTIFEQRATPATAEEFLEHGLELKDYLQYIGLLHVLQGELLLYGEPKAETFLTKEKTQKTTYPSVERLLTFCKEKNLIEQDDQLYDPWYYSHMFLREDAEYFHGWIRFPKEFSEFRLHIERKLSFSWDEEDLYITENFGGISFSYDDISEVSPNHFLVNFGSGIHIKNFNPKTKDLEILDHCEVLKIFETVQRDMKDTEREIATHLAQMPNENEADAIERGLPWVKKMFALYDRRDIIESVLGNVKNAVDTQNVYQFKQSDILFVFCGKNTCKEAQHLQSDMKVEFSFYGKPNKQYTIKRCAHCKQFQISLDDLLSMFDNYGVPKATIIYDSGDADFSQFPETSTLHRKGYSVSQAEGLSAEQRQNILKHAIESGDVSKKEVLNFLYRRISINGMKEGNEMALRKWQADYEFVRNL